jgi:hypothetical protein
MKSKGISGLRSKYQGATGGGNIKGVEKYGFRTDVKTPVFRLNLTIILASS